MGLVKTSKVVKQDITRDKFHVLVKKSAQPLKANVFGSASHGTSELHRLDDCNGKNTH